MFLFIKNLARIFNRPKDNFTAPLIFFNYTLFLTSVRQDVKHIDISTVGHEVELAIKCVTGLYTTILESLGNKYRPLCLWKS